MRYAKRVVPLVLLLSMLISSVAFAAPNSQSGGYYYTVSWGDTLSSIAARAGVNSWAIANANGLSNPNYIWIGQVLWIPAAYQPVYNPVPPYRHYHPAPPTSCGSWRAVYFGDTMFSISRAAGVSPWEIARANGLSNPIVVYAGTSLWIPCGNGYGYRYGRGYGH